MNNEWKNGKPKRADYSQGNPSGSVSLKRFSHAQRIGTETVNAEYNVPTSHSHLEQVKRYAELIRNYKK